MYKIFSQFKYIRFKFGIKKKNKKESAIHAMSVYTKR